MFQKENVNLEILGNTKKEVLLNISLYAKNMKYVEDHQKLFHALATREQEVSTAIGDQFAIPHARSDFIKKPQILFVRFKQTINWSEKHIEPVRHAFVLLVPNKLSDLQVQILKRISLMLLDNNIQEKIKKSLNVNEIYNLIQEKLYFEDLSKNQEINKLESYNNRKKIVGVCSCPAGIAHTYLAKEKLEQAAKKLGYVIKLETRGAIIENELTNEDINGADYIILATDLEIDWTPFANKIVYETSTNNAIHNPIEVIKNTTLSSVYINKNTNINNEIKNFSQKNKLRKIEKNKLKIQTKKAKKQYLIDAKENRDAIKKIKHELKQEIQKFNKKIDSTLKYNATTLTKQYEKDFKYSVELIKKQIKNLNKNVDQNNIQDLYNKIADLFFEYNEKLKNIAYNKNLSTLKKTYGQNIILHQNKIKESYQNYKNISLKYESTKNKIWVKAIFSSIGYLIPLIICGGLFIAFGSLFTKIEVDPNIGAQKWLTPPFPNAMKDLGGGILGLIPAFLSMYIAYAIGNKPALAPAFIGGMMISNSKIMSQLLLFDPNNIINGVEVDVGIVNGGFVGGLIVGYLSGYISKAISKLNFSKNLIPIISLLFNPLITLFILFVLIAYVIGTPITFIMILIYSGLFKLSEFNNPGVNILIAIIFSMMINFDFGGPINKIAFFLSGTIAISSLTANGGDISKSNYLAQNAVQAAISIGPLGAYFATLLFPYKFNKEEKIAGRSALIMGMFGISEGVLPFVFVRARKVIFSALIAAFISGILIGLLSTYNNAKFVAGLGSPIGAWVGYAPGTGFGFYWFLIVIFSSLIMAITLGLLIEKNEIVYEQYKKIKLERKMVLQSLGYFNWFQILKYNTKKMNNEFVNSIKKLRKIQNWVRK